MNLIEAAIKALAAQRAVNPHVIDKAIGKLHEVLVLLETAEPVSTATDAPTTRQDLRVFPAPPSLRMKNYRPPMGGSK